MRRKKKNKVVYEVFNLQSGKWEDSVEVDEGTIYKILQKMELQMAEHSIMDRITDQYIGNTSAFESGD